MSDVSREKHYGGTVYLRPAFIARYRGQPSDLKPATERSATIVRNIKGSAKEKKKKKKSPNRMFEWSIKYDG